MKNVGFFLQVSCCVLKGPCGDVSWVGSLWE